MITQRKHIETTDWQKPPMSSKYSGPPLPLKMKKQQGTGHRRQPRKPPPQKQADQLPSNSSAPLPSPRPPLTSFSSHANGDTVVLDVWQLCFQVCFVNYAADYPQPRLIEICFDIDNEVNWISLDEKAKTPGRNCAAESERQIPLRVLHENDYSICRDPPPSPLPLSLKERGSESSPRRA